MHAYVYLTQYNTTILKRGRPHRDRPREQLQPEAVVGRGWGAAASWRQALREDEEDTDGWWQQ